MHEQESRVAVLQATVQHYLPELDVAIKKIEAAGDGRILFRGDTDFSQTEHLDRWDQDGVRFIFGIDATPALYEIAENLPQNAWKELRCRPKRTVRTVPRRRAEKVKQQIVEQRGFEDVRLAKEYVAEFIYRPAKCHMSYRVVAVWKDLEVYQGQKKLFDDLRCFFYITNAWGTPTEEVVFGANQRCNQENILQQLKSGVRSLSAPVDNLVSNWAYMVMAPWRGA